MKSGRTVSTKPKGDGIRILRVEKEVLFQLSKYIMSSFRGDLPGLLTLTRVQMTADLRTARVYFSLLQATPEDEEVTHQWLRDHAADMQSHLGKQLQMRYTPKLSFIADKGLEKAMRVDQLLHELQLKASQ